MSRASEELLAQLHNMVARDLMDKIRSGEATSADLNAAIKFLKDNQIMAEAEPRDPSFLLEDDDALPFQVINGLKSITRG